MKYSIKNVKFSVDYKIAENEHGIFDGNIEELTVELDKSEFLGCYDALKSIVKDAVNTFKEVRQSELQKTAAAESRNCHYKCGNKRDKEKFTKR